MLPVSLALPLSGRGESSGGTNDDGVVIAPLHPRWHQDHSRGRPDLLKAFQQFCQDNLRFEPGEMRSRTDVGAGDKGQMRVGLPPDIEMVRVSK